MDYDTAFKRMKKGEWMQREKWLVATPYSNPDPNRRVRMLGDNAVAVATGMRSLLEFHYLFSDEDIQATDWIFWDGVNKPLRKYKPE